MRQVGAVSTFTSSRPQRLTALSSEFGKIDQRGVTLIECSRSNLACPDEILLLPIQALLHISKCSACVLRVVARGLLLASRLADRLGGQPRLMSHAEGEASTTHGHEDQRAADDCPDENRPGFHAHTALPAQPALM